MPNESNPIDGQPWPLSAFLRDSPLWTPSGVVGSPAAASTAGDLALSFDIVSGTSVTPKLALGRGRSRGGRFERTGSSWTSGMSGTAPQQGSAPYALNTGSNPRRDRIVIRRDAALQAVYPIILVGTPAATPSAPALTQVENGIWDTPLFSWTLPGGSSTAPTNITDERPWIHPDGSAAPLNGIDLNRTSTTAIGTGVENQGFAATDVVRDRGGFYTGSGVTCATMPGNLGGKCLLSVGGSIDGGAAAQRFIILLDVAGAEVLRANGYGEDVAHATRELWVPSGATFGVRVLQGCGTGRSLTGLYLSVHLLGT